MVGVLEVGKKSDRFQQAVILGVRSEKEPIHRVAIPDADDSEIESAASRPNGIARMNLLETKARMKRIVLP